MSIYLRNFIRFVILILIQALLLNKIPLNWWAPPYIAFVYPLFILLLPIATPTSYMMLFGFIVGITMDAFMNTGGMQAMSCVLIAYCRRPVLKAFLPQPLKEYKNATPGTKTMTWGAFLAYAAILMFIHNFVYTLLDVWSFKSMLYALSKTGITFLTSMIFVILYLLVFTKSINRKIYD